MILPSKVNDINVLLNLIEKLNFLSSDSVPEDNIQNYLNIINYLMANLRNILPHKNQEINFFLEQFSNFNSQKEQYRYNADFLIFCSLLNSISPHAYYFF